VGLNQWPYLQLVKAGFGSRGNLGNQTLAAYTHTLSEAAHRVLVLIPPGLLPAVEARFADPAPAAPSSAGYSEAIGCCSLP
jgi:hypothetical protein